MFTEFSDCGPSIATQLEYQQIPAKLATIQPVGGPASTAWLDKLWLKD